VATTNHGRAEIEMDETLVTIAVFQSQTEFLLARTRLQSADIECFAYDENILRIGGWHSHMFGGIRLQVRESEAQDARAILQQPALPDNP
jgi:Putative prokaryotic signal transducing protein